MNLLELAIGFTIGNFVYQMITGKRDWKRAFEISYFQAIAFLAVWLRSLL